MRPWVRLSAGVVVCLSVMLSSACLKDPDENVKNNGGGGGGGNTPVSIHVNGTFPVGIVGVAYPAQNPPVLTAAGGTAPFTWSVTTGTLPAGLILNSSNGTISGTPTTAGQQFGFTLQVKDAKSTTATQQVGITIDTAISIATTSLPGGITGGNYSSSLTISGGTAPYSGKVSAGSLPPGLSLDASSGTISGVPTTAGTYSFTTQVTDADNVSTSAQLSITIAQQAPLTITTTSLPDGTAGVPYEQSLNASGGIPPYTWMISSGSAPGLGISAVGFAGTPTVAGTDQFTLQVTDSAASPNSKSQNYVLTINPGGGTFACGTTAGSESLLSGPWAFLLNGFDSSGNPLAVAGSFTANGKGGITGGEEDYNDAGVGPSQRTLDTATSSYSLQADGRGCLSLVTTIGTSAAFAFVLNSANQNPPTKGRIIEFDDASNTVGTARLSGILRPQTMSAFALSALQPNYAFGVSGWDPGENPFAMAGSFTLDNTSGNISNGFMDADDFGNITFGLPPITGSISTTVDSNGRASMTYAPNGSNIDFTIYIVNQNQFFMVGSDIPGAVPLTSGEAIVTGNSFTNASLSAGSILETTGYSWKSSPAGADVMIGQLSFDGIGAVGGTLFEDQAGTSSTTAVSNTVATYSVGGGGRVSMPGVGTSPPVAYLTTPTDGISAFLVGTDLSASLGLLQAQASGPYNPSSLSGDYIVGTSQLGDGTSAIAQVGTMAFSSTTAGAGTGVVDQSQSSANGLLLNQALKQNYSIDNDGTGNAGANTAAVTNGTTIYFVDETDTTPGGHPSILVIEQ